MMKITVNYLRLSGVAIVGGLGLSGCAPIPQAYPALPQHQAYQQPQQRPVPQAAPLVQQQQAKQVISIERHAAVPAQRPVQRQQVQAAVPPTLQPAQQQARPVAKKAKARPAPAKPRQQSRPSQVSTYRPPTPRPVTPAPAEEWVDLPVKKKTVKARPLPPPVQPRPVQSTPQTTKKALPEVEVPDMSSSAKKPVSEPVVERKVTPPSPAYKDSPAVVILIKQANNQLVVGKTDQAASTLERALRIAPDNPMLWLRLAEVNEQQGNKAQAASMAKKAIGMAPDDANIKQRGSRLIN